jgi:hypothetical protein
MEKVSKKNLPFKGRKKYMFKFIKSIIAFTHRLICLKCLPNLNSKESEITTNPKHFGGILHVAYRDF